MQDNLFKKNKDFRNIFIGQIVSSLGTNIYSYIIGFYLLATTESIMFFGIYLTVINIVEIILKYIISVIIESKDKVKIIYSCDYIQGCVMLIGYFYLICFNSNKLVVVIVISIISSIVNSIFTPAISSLYPVILKDTEIMEGNSYRTAFNKLQVIISIALSGLLYEILTIESVLLINGISFLISGYFESRVNGDYQIKIERKESFFTQFKYGVKYIIKNPLLLHYNILSAIINIYYIGFITILTRFIILEYYDLKEYYYSLLVVIYSIFTILTTYMLNKKKVAEYLAMCIGISLQLISLIIILLFLDFKVIFFLSIILSNIGLTYYNLPMVSKVLTLIDKKYMSRTIGTMSFIGAVTIPLSNYIYGYMLEKLNVLYSIYFSIIVLVVSLVFINFSEPLKSVKK